MRRPWTRTLLVAMLLALGPVPARADGPGQSNDRELAAKLFKDCQAPVLYLSGFKNAKEEVFTGFLVDERTLITVAHGVTRSNVIQVRLPEGGFVTCDILDVRADLDLAALRLPKDVTLGRLVLRPDDERLERGEFAMLIGYPRGMSEWFDHGHVTSSTKTRGQLFEELTGKKGPAGAVNPVVVQHTVASAVGYSGAPLLDRKGRVAAVHSDGTQSETKLSFAIPGAYVRQLDLKKKAVALSGPPLKTLPATGLVPHAKGRGAKPPDVGPTTQPPRTGGPDLWCYTRGEVPHDPDLIFRNYIGDQDRFEALVRKPYLEEMLDRHDAVVHITNPAFRFSFLSLCCSEFDQDVSRSPEGVRLKLTLTEPKDDEDFRIPPVLRELHAAAWRMHEPPADRPDLTGQGYVSRLLQAGRAVRDRKEDRAWAPSTGTHARAAGDAKVAERQLRLLHELAPKEFFGLTIHPAGTRPRPGFGDEDVCVNESMTDKAPVPAVKPGTGRMLACYDRLGQEAHSLLVLYAVHDGMVLVAWMDVYTPALHDLTRPLRRGARLPVLPPDLIERVFVLASLSFH